MYLPILVTHVAGFILERRSIRVVGIISAVLICVGIWKGFSHIHSQSNMEQVAETGSEQYEFTLVHTLSDDTGAKSVSFRTDGGREVLIPDDETGRMDAQFVRRSAEEGKVIFVAYDLATGRCHFAVPFNEDYVGSIQMDPALQGGLKVFLVLRPSPLVLSPEDPRFELFRERLETAKSEGRRVWVGTFPGDSAILDVQIVPSGTTSNQ